jgi:hypothetical protein
MKYAAKIRAESGWFYVLGASDGKINLIELKLWGMVSHPTLGVQLVPLDNIHERDVSKLKNFVKLLDPNKQVMNSEVETELLQEWKTKREAISEI